MRKTHYETNGFDGCAETIVKQMVGESVPARRAATIRAPLEGGFLLRPKVALYYKKPKTLVSDRPLRSNVNYVTLDVTLLRWGGYPIWDGRWGKVRVFSGVSQHAEFNFEVRCNRRGLHIGQRGDRPMLRSATLRYAVVV